MITKKRIIFLIFLVLTQIIISCNSTKIIRSESDKNYEIQKNEINHEGIYVSKDTLYSIDKNYKNEITIRLLKLNKDKTVQISNPYTFKEGENKLNNINLTDWLFSETSYNYTLKGESKLIIKCYAKRAKTCWYCWGGPGRISEISEKFVINGDTLIRLKKSNKNFRKKYILDRSLNINHKKIRIGNACS
ncbi:hypothetical protein [Flavobacterium sp.]|uniref:hypothetical protein n=1 Tax=Flavobacterium sp. TaxID=239 RepID=UPI002B4AE05C|nr:hypothetical protein [Flavobacterium sp.]HLF53204.1 hypothetical protein [Flavobacterium sp.]